MSEQSKKHSEKLKLWHSTKEKLPVWVDSTAQHIHITSRLQLFAQQIIINVLDCVTPCLQKQYLTYWRRHRIGFVMIFQERKRYIRSDPVGNSLFIRDSWKIFVYFFNCWKVWRVHTENFSLTVSSSFYWQIRRLYFCECFEKLNAIKNILF